ncbi:branched-chain amino acid transport system II carrier protein [uncultured Rothia sp.]|uniref:branched-chain amino acid transport system II carrier protein n=1 Tax=uncultured Rothia sp. TaxID=316088 RepID=UPI003216F144
MSVIPPGTRKAGFGGIVVVTALMLFSIFFGAGNLIFPPMLGAQSGENFVPALIGFLVTGVLLPLLAIFALVRSGSDLSALASRGGKIFALIFPVLVYLAIGAFYAVPRTATVSYALFITPVFGIDSQIALIIYAVVFFAISLLICIKPSNIVDALGKYLTPALVFLLFLLVIVSFFKLHGTPAPAIDDYQGAPLVSGFLQGYFTMDSLAGLVFGIILISSLQYKGLTKENGLSKGILYSSLLAGSLLALIYIGLAWIGRSIENGQSYEDGAALLSSAAQQTLGTPGLVILGLIVVLACLTTAVGLLSSTSEFFERLFPKISYTRWLIIFTVVAFLVSIMGLATVLAIAGPILGFLYPIAITLIALTLLEPLVAKPLGKKLNYTFRFALTVATVWAALMTLNTVGWGSSAIAPLISWSPGHALDLGWVAPVAIAAVAGYVVDAVKKSSEQNVKS